MTATSASGLRQRMPARDEHLAKADHGATVAASLMAEPASVEWAITVLFYRAVHVVEAWFALSGIHHQSHQARTRAVDRQLPEIAADYGDLLEASRTARYERDGIRRQHDHARMSDALRRIDDRVRSDVR